MAAQIFSILLKLSLIALITCDCGAPGLSSATQQIDNLLIAPSNNYPENHTVSYQCPMVGSVQRVCRNNHWSGEIVKCPKKLDTKVSGRIPKQNGLNFIWNGQRKIVAVKLYLQTGIKTLPEFSQRTTLVNAHMFGPDVEISHGEDVRLNENNDIKRHFMLIKRKNLNAKGTIPTSIIQLEFSNLNIERKCELSDRDGVPSTSFFGGNKKTNCVRADLTEVYYLDESDNYCYMPDIPGNVQDVKINGNEAKLTVNYECKRGYEFINENLRENQCISGQDWLFYGPVCYNRTMDTMGLDRQVAFGPLPFAVANDLKIELLETIADFNRMQLKLNDVYEKLRNATEFNFN